MVSNTVSDSDADVGMQSSGGTGNLPVAVEERTAFFFSQGRDARAAARVAAP
jgi:hypothetical protein